jgi:hypothetical protein
MYFLFMKIINIDYKEDIVLGLQSVGVSKASIIESKDLDETLGNEMSLFTGFFKALGEREGEQLIVTALIDSEDQAREFIQNLKEAEVPLDTEDILRLIIWPVSATYEKDTGFLHH